LFVNEMVLSEPEQAELAVIGALAAGALEAGIDGWQPGETVTSKSRRSQSDWNVAVPMPSVSSSAVMIAPS